MNEQILNGKIDSKNLLDKLNSLKRNAFNNLDRALEIDSNSNENNMRTDEAISLYERGLESIESAVNFYETNQTYLNSFDEAKNTYVRLKSLHEQTSERLNYLKTKRISNKPLYPTIDPLSSTAPASTSTLANASNLNEDFLEIGEDILGADSNDYLIIDDELLDQSKHANSDSRTDFSKATEVLCLDNGVKLFYISNDGSVSTPSYPTTLSVYSFDDQEAAKSRNGKRFVGFIRVGSWLYPLVPNELPGMKTNFNAYIFPNEDEELKNANCSFVGITFAEEISSDQRLFFEDVLINYGSLIYQDERESNGVKRPSIPQLPPPLQQTTQPSTSIANATYEPPFNLDTRPHEPSKLGQSKIDTTAPESKPKTEPDTQSKNSAERIAEQIKSGAQMITRGVSSSTSYGNKLLQNTGEKLKSQLNPNAEVVPVDPRVQSLIQNVRYGTHLSVRVSSYLVNKLGTLATSVGRTVAPHIKQGSSALLSKTVARDKANANNYVENVCTVAGSSIQGIGMVYDSLEQAAKSLSKSFADQTVTVVEHK